MKNHYDVLGVARTATLDEIKMAFRSRVKRTHPDSRVQLAGDDTEFLRVHAAYSILKDPDARTRYDQTLPSTSLTIVPNPDHAGANSNANTYRYSEASCDFPNEKKAKPKVQPISAKWAVRVSDDDQGRPCYAVSISLEQAFGVMKVYVPVSRNIACSYCFGHGINLEKGPTCTRCNGTGRAGQRSLVGRLLFGDPCPLCSAHGTIRVPRVCSTCSGHGYTTHNDGVRVDIPPGVRNGGVFPVRGQNCTLRVEVLPNKLFSRDGDNLRVSKLLKESSLKKGVTVSVAGLDGIKRSVRVPPGSVDGSEILVPRCGMPRLNGEEIGDLIVVVRARSET